MAEQMKPNGGEGPPATHNVVERDKQIQDAMEEMYQADRRIAAALEKHVQPHREVKKDCKKKLRESLQLTTEVINAEYATFRLTRHAMDNQDDKTLDLIREMYERLPKGEILDLEAVAKKAAEAEQPSA